MEIRRKEHKGEMWLWLVEYEENPVTRQMVPRFKQPLAREPPEAKPPSPEKEVPAIVWSFGRTLGNIAVYSAKVLGSFPDQAYSEQTTLDCDFVAAGKFRNGAPRQWCRTHQAHWGRKADIAYAVGRGKMQCANRDFPLAVLRDPPTFDTSKHAELAVWCALGVGLSNRPIQPQPPRIHVHVRESAASAKKVDQNYQAVSILVSKSGMFGDAAIQRINITPPAAYDYVRCVEEGREMVTVECNRCKAPHLDLGEFSRRPHKKHTCGNCGWDHTWSDGPVISNPLQRLFDTTAGNVHTVDASETLDLDKYARLKYDVWASTPAIVWTAKRPQKKGIHVHVYDGGKEIVNETFGTVLLEGKPLNRTELYQAMLGNTVVPRGTGAGVSQMM